MFGIVRPCSHGMCGPLFEEWKAHLCGLCLALRSEHGQVNRLVTNYDSVLVSVLVEAQSGRSPRRKAGPCVLRGLRTANVIDAGGEAARFAAAVSLLLAAGKIRDHVADRDGVYSRRPVAAVAGRVADRWEAAGARTSADIGFDPAPLREVVGRQGMLESAGHGLPALAEPTESAVAQAFAHTAVLAGKPHNTETLAEMGRLFGRIVYLVDAAEDLDKDRAAGAYNALLATGTDLDDARRHCDAALLGLRWAIADLDLDNPRLLRALLDREVHRLVDRRFGGRRQCAASSGPRPPSGPDRYAPGAPLRGHTGSPRRPVWPALCLAWSLVGCTCGLWQPPWSEHHGKHCGERCWCSRNCDCSCDCCDCDCCDCDCCDCGCDCG